MTATADNAVAALQRANAELQRLLAERTAELREKNERYELVSQAVAEGVYDWNVEDNTLFVSPRLIEIFGFDDPGLNSQDWFARVHADDREAYRSALRDCFKGSLPKVNCEYRILVRSGEYRWVEDHGLPIRNEAGRAIRLVGAVSDITERKQREAELSEALEQQTATAEILRVISNSPTDVQPTLDAIAASATTLSGADIGNVARFDGSLIHLVAHHNWTGAQLEALQRVFPCPPSRGSVAGRAILTRAVVHIPDLAVDPESAHLPTAHSGPRATLAAPLLRDGDPIGAIAVSRYRPEPFSEVQIELVKTFADQAVIAMENVRLFDELRETLEQQTATAEVLQIIVNSSPGNLEPVFDALLERATRLCGADFAAITIRDGDIFRYVAAHGTTDEVSALLRSYRIVPGRGTIAGRVVLAGEVVHIADCAADPEYEATRVAALAGSRTALGVPLLRDGEVVGTFALLRQRVEPYTEAQIEMVRNFATQAAIAIENARLITETQEALAQQTATAEVLQVINSSQGDLAPVFDALLERAMRLCDAAFGMMRRYDGEHLAVVAMRGVPDAYAQFLSENPQSPTAGTAVAQLVEGAAFYHSPDAAAESAHRRPAWRALIELGGARATLAVPLRKDGALLGTITLCRQEVRPFTDKQIALLQNFASQAVIAIENDRLLDEIRQRQAELRVTFDNMDHGVAMFDPDLRLAAWNRNFQELLDLPDEFLAEAHSFEAYIRYLAVRGEFGGIDPDAELARLRGKFGDHYSFERTRPDGRVIEVRHNPMPEGGFVLIYSDITERKRSEAEIREARDEAQNALRDLQAAQGRLIQAEKMASLGQLTAGIAHEIKNPLNFVNNFASLSNELLGELREIAAPALATLDANRRTDLDDTMDMLSGNLEKIAEHGRRADNIVKGMLEHSRGVSGERRSVDINALVEEALNLAYHGARAQDQGFNITLERDFDHAAKPIDLVPQDMTRVFLNLFGNGFYAANERAHANGGAGFRPVLHVATRDAGDGVEVKVRDNGTGIPPAIRDRLFQPFFTTKPTGEGTGLGLSISYDIVTQGHGGTIAVDSEEGSFTEFTIRLPRGGAAAPNGTARG
jgi:PAS domain S-box-containing protein